MSYYNTQDPVTKENINAFMRQARLLTEAKINFNKGYAKRLNIMNTFFEMSQQLLGKDFNFLQDAVSTRLYIRDVFGVKYLRYFEDSEGEMVLDTEHALLFYYKLLSEEGVTEDDKKMQVALGVLYFIAGHQLDDEVAQISKVAPKDLITPSFRLDASLYSWKRCNHILRKYMLQMAQIPGYKAYYFERPLLNQIAYLTYHGEDFQSATTKIEQMEHGIFYTFLPIEIESMLIPSILSGGFDDTLMDGYYTQTFIRDKKEIEKTYPLDATYNVYNLMLKPILVDLMGMVINNVVAETEATSYIHPNEFRVHHLTPHRLGVIIKEGINIESVLPNLHTRFKPVQEFSFTEVLEGGHL